jgi:hypothetical protein
LSQTGRTAAVARSFSRSWDLLLGRRGWWPDERQVECARLLREAGSGAGAITSEEFVVALGASLRSWRAFRGVRFEHERVVRSLQMVAPMLGRWEGTSILTLRRDRVADLFELFEAIQDIKPTSRKWVVTSKTLYHLLPDLIVPMDNLMTAPFLGRSSLPATFEPAFLVEAYAAFVDLAANREHGIGSSAVRRAATQVPFPVSSASPEDCRIGLARVVDFAIAGFVLEHGRSALRTAS